MSKSRCPSGRASSASLCLECALCCNGVLFDDVKLRPEESPRALSALGLSIRNALGRSPKFLQPCGCLDGTRCQVYAGRPVQCRAFECRLLQRVTDGERSMEDALEVIHRARRLVKSVEKQLKASGELHSDRALGWRYTRVMRSPMELDAEPDAAENRGRLMRAMDRLMRVLQREFLGA